MKLNDDHSCQARFSCQDFQRIMIFSLLLKTSYDFGGLKNVMHGQFLLHFLFWFWQPLFTIHSLHGREQDVQILKCLSVRLFLNKSIVHFIINSVFIHLVFTLLRNVYYKHISNCSFELYQRILKKCIMFTQKILSSMTVFNWDNNKKCYLSISISSASHISILEWFLKDHVTPKTGFMTPENSALPSQ